MELFAFKAEKTRWLSEGFVYEPLCKGLPVTSYHGHFIFWLHTMRHGPCGTASQSHLIPVTTSRALHTSTVHTKVTSSQSLHFGPFIPSTSYYRHSVHLQSVKKLCNIYYVLYAISESDLFNHLVLNSPECLERKWQFNSFLKQNISKKRLKNIIGAVIGDINDVTENG